MASNLLKMARKLTYREGDRLFEPFNDLTIILAALGRAMHQVGKTGRDAGDFGVMRMKPKIFDYAVAIPLLGPLEIAFRGDLPEGIDIGLIDLADAQGELEGPTKVTSGFGSVMNHIMQPIFLGFFERYNVWLTATSGEAVNWPMTLNFARVVRNAVAHGAINFRNPRTPPVSWKSLTYTYADRGRRIIPDDLGPTDLIGLMIEADEELTSMGAPVL